MAVALLLACCWMLAYFRARLWLWTAALAMFPAIWLISAPACPTSALLAWALFLPVAALLNITPLRRAVLTTYFRGTGNNRI